MDVLLQALILGVVEGLTEFLPVSSTGHLILVGDLLGFNDEKGKMFEIMIQCGAILAVCWEYRARFGTALTGLLSDRAAQRFALNLAVAFIPLAVLGLAFGTTIKAVLFKPVPVALAFIVGGFVILWAEKRDHRVTVETVEAMTWRDALKVGIAQCFALIPGSFILCRIPRIGNLASRRIQRNARIVAFLRSDHAVSPVFRHDGHPVSRDVYRCRRLRSGRWSCLSSTSLSERRC